MAIKTLRVFAEYTSTGFVPMPVAGGIDYGYTLANTFPSTQPSTFQTDDPDIDVTVTAMTDFYVWIRISGTAWNPSYTRNVRVYPDSPDINSVVMNMIIATGPAGVSSYTQIVQTANRLYFNGATTDSVYNSKFAGKTYINELNFGTAPQLATVATSGAYADLSGKPALATVATSGLYTDLSSKPSGTAPISYNSGTNSFVITQANSTTNGFLTSTDWNTFNNKYLLPTGGTTAQYLRGDGTLATFPTTIDSTRLIMSGKNTTGATLTKGTVVYINGVSGNTPLFAKAIASGDSTSAQTLGVVEFDINNNQTGVVVLVGSVTNLDTSSYTEGVQLYLSGTTAGTFTSTKILAPTHLVYVGIVTRAHPTQGVIEVKIQNGYELDEIHDVQISSPADKHILYYDNATTLWKHSSVTSVLGYTPYNATNPSNYIALTALSASAPLSYNNTTGAFTIAQANGSTNGFLSSTDWTTFNSKQSALTIGNFTEVNSNVFMFPDGGTGKTIGNLSIQMIQAGASTNGYLSSTDWTTFNNKQNAITGGATTILTSDLTASRALISNASGKVDVSTVTSTELGYLNGVTSAIQTQLNAKQATITNPVTGTGTTNYVTKWTSGSAVGNSLIFDNGSNIGINTTSPSNLAGYTIISLNNTTTGGIYELMLSGVVQARFFSNSTSSGIGSVSNNPLLFITNDTEKMRITSTGNVGINTTTFTPFGNRLQMIMKGDNTSGVSIFQIISSDLASSLALFSGSSTSDNPALIYQKDLRFGSATDTGLTGYTERMRITSSGNIGIGTITTLYSTHIVNNGGNAFLGISNQGAADGNRQLRLGFGGNGSHTYASIQGTRYNTADDVNLALQAGGGLVGIGTSSLSSPNLRLGEKLAIVTVNDYGGLSATTYSGAASGRSSVIDLQKSRGSSDGSMTAVANGDEVGYVIFRGADGTNFVDGAYIRADVEGTVSGGSVPMRMVFHTGPSSTSERMRITAGGNILMGTTSDNGERLYVSGAIRATGNITANSDLTLKKNLKLIENPIDKLMSLNGYSYQWKENDEYQYGVIAQEVEKVMSYAVQTGNNGIKGVAYNQLTPLLIEGFKLHNQKIDLNTSEITQLKERVKYLEAKLA